MTQRHHKHATLAHADSGKPTAATTTADTVRDNEHNGKVVSDEDIRTCAYHKWEAAGRPGGDGVQFWLEAEQELLEGKKEKIVHRDSWPQHPEDERREAQKAVKRTR